MSPKPITNKQTHVNTLTRESWTQQHGILSLSWPFAALWFDAVQFNWGVKHEIKKKTFIKGSKISLNCIMNEFFIFQVHCAEFIDFSAVVNLHDFYSFSSTHRTVAIQAHGSPILMCCNWLCFCFLQLLDCYFETYQHAAGTEQRFALVRVITGFMHSRPQLDLDQDYFVQVYRAEMDCLRSHQQLIKDILDNPVKTKAHKGFRSCAGGWGGGVLRVDANVWMLLLELLTHQLVDQSSDLFCQCLDNQLF